jgi:hypothetical protein
MKTKTTLKDYFWEERYDKRSEKNPAFFIVRNYFLGSIWDEIREFYRGEENSIWGLIRQSSPVVLSPVENPSLIFGRRIALSRYAYDE